MAETSRDACFTSIRKMIEIAFLSYRLKNLWHYNRSKAEVGAFRKLGYFAKKFLVERSCFPANFWTPLDMPKIFLQINAERFNINKRCSRHLSTKHQFLSHPL